MKASAACAARHQSVRLEIAITAARPPRPFSTSFFSQRSPQPAASQSERPSSCSNTFPCTIPICISTILVGSVYDCMLPAIFTTA